MANRNKRILLAVSESELIRYKKSAHEKYMNLSEYIRKCVDNDLKKLQKIISK